MRYRKSNNRKPMTDKERQVNHLLNNIMDNRIAMGAMRQNEMKGVSNDQKPVQQTCSAIRL
jgi:hypothetical protein